MDYLLKIFANMYVCYSEYPNAPTCVTVEESQTNKQPSAFGINHSRHFYCMKPAEVYFQVLNERHFSS